MKLSDLGEWGLIRQLRERLPASGGGVIVGLGDDAAVLEPLPGLALFTCDTMVEGVHFRRRWATPRQVGWKVLVQNLSDIAAMGGEPTAAVVSLALPGDLPVSFVSELYDGLESAAREYGAALAGGDTVGSPGPVAITVALLGHVNPGEVIRRSGAQAGDALLVTGTLGGPAAGLRWLERRRKITPEVEPAVRALLEPVPQISAGRVLARSGRVHAMIDVSDGLADDASHLAEESGVGVRVYDARLPIHPAARIVAEALGESAMALARAGGEEYELLFTCAAAEAEGLTELLLREAKTAATIIGEVTADPGERAAVTAEGAAEPLGRGYQHFGRSRVRKAPKQ